LGLSQAPCNCCTQDHKAFDFWIGDWKVYNDEGEKIGRNTIDKLEENCLVSKRWKGEKVKKEIREEVLIILILPIVPGTNYG
tara:strand:- start:84 stop:329 length:246 start_codon:yes stop_codon:yes gene_type:complete